MLLHFVAHRGKYGLLADKFGFTRSCYFSCVEEMLGIVTGNLLRKHIVWPTCERQKEMSDYYNQRFSFPGVIGAIDGMHITISKPPAGQFLEDYFSVRKKMYTMLLQVCRTKILDPPVPSNVCVCVCGVSCFGCAEIKILDSPRVPCNEDVSAKNTFHIFHLSADSPQ